MVVGGEAAGGTVAAGEGLAPEDTEQGGRVPDVARGAYPGRHGEAAELASEDRQASEFLTESADSDCPSDSADTEAAAEDGVATLRPWAASASKGAQAQAGAE